MRRFAICTAALLLASAGCAKSLPAKTPQPNATAAPVNHVLVYQEEGVTRVKSGKTKAMLFQSPRPKEAIQWAMNHSPITIVTEGTYTLSGTIEIPRTNISLVITEKATLVATQDASLTKVSEGHGNYYPLIRNAGHDNVNIINFGTLDPSAHVLGNKQVNNVAILFDGRNGGTCGINGGMIFSCGTLRSNGDAVWIVDARYVRVPLIWCDEAGNTLAIEGCEDLSIGTIAELNATGRTKGRHGNEAIDLNSYCRRVHVELAIGTPPLEEVVDINNSPDCVFDEVRAYGRARTVKFRIYPPTGKRLTQKSHISHSNGTVVKTEKVIKQKLKSWKTQIDVRGIPDQLPIITVAAKLTAVFEDGTTEQVLDRIYRLDLSTPTAAPAGVIEQPKEAPRTLLAFPGAEGAGRFAKE